MTEQVGLYAKMVKVMEKMGRVPKRGHNDHFHYDFVTDADVLDAVRAAMVSEKIALFVSFDGAERQDKGVTVGKFVLTFVDAETGQTHSVNWIGEGQDTQDKGSAKAATSAVKYALLKTFLISTGDDTDDTDANAGNGKPKTQPPAPAPRKAVPAPAPVGYDEPPMDAWDSEEQADASAFVADTVKVLTTKAGKPYLMFTAGDEAASWFKGRDELLKAAPWISQHVTKDQLAEGAHPLRIRVEYETNGQYRNAVAFSQA